MSGYTPGPALGGAMSTGIPRPADGAWHRMHPATPLLRGGIVFIAIFGVLFANVREQLINAYIGSSSGEGGGSGDPFGELERHGLVGWAVLAVIAVVAVLVFVAWLSWRMQAYRVTTTAVELRGGVVFRSNRQARLDRIQSVNIHRPLLARLFGAARVEVVVAGHDANLILSYLGSPVAEELRRELLGLAHHAPQTDVIDELFVSPADLHTDGARADEVFSVHPGRLAGSILVSHTSVVILAIIAFVVWQAVDRHFVWLIALLPTLLGFGSASVRRFTRLARYRISTAAGGVRVGYGLLGTSSETIAARRIHAIELAQPLIWRPFGWWQLRMVRAGHSKERGQAESASVLLPVGSAAEVARVLPLALSGVDASRLAALVAEVTGGAAGGAGSYTSAPGRAAWLRPFSWRRSGYAFSGEVVSLRHGFIWRSATFVPIARLQSVALTQGPLRRALGLAELHVHVVDGRVRPHLPVIATADAEGVFASLAARTVADAAAEDAV